MSEIAVIDSWAKELANVEDVKELITRDQKAAALERVFFKDAEAREQQIRIIKYRAEIARQGQRAVEMMRQRGELAEQNNKKTGSVENPVSLQSLGVGKTKADQWRKLFAIPDQEFESYFADAITTEKDPRLKDVVEFGRKFYGDPIKKTPQPSVDDGCEISDLESCKTKFGTIYADPPWLYGNQATRAATGNHYGGMSVDEICDMPIEQLADDVAHLHLWTTNGFLPDAFRVMEAWGFEYKSCFVWVKPQMGIGNYWRVSHEYMLLGTRGSCVFADKSLMSWAEFNRTRHSAKPDEIRHMIEKASPGPRLELFARRLSPGWVSWGNEIERTMFDEAVATV